MDQLHQNAIDFIEDLVADKMNSNEAFTSLDIANEAKSNGFYARNRMVANWLRSNAIRISHENGHLYNQTLIRVDSKKDGMTLAYLYHDMNTPADSYLDRDQNPLPWRNRATPASAPIQQQVSSGFLPSFPSPKTTQPFAPLVNKFMTPKAQRGSHHCHTQKRDSKGRFC